MNKALYVCSKCKKSFRRRWNAQRHNDTVHKGLAHIYTRDKSGISREDASKNKPNHHHPSSAGVLNSWKYGQMHKHGSKHSPFATFSSGSPRKKQNETVRTLDEGEIQDFVDMMSERMAICFEKLEKLFFGRLYPYAPYEKTRKALCEIHSAALVMPDPIRYMQEKFTYYNRQYCSANMTRYVVESCGIDTNSAAERLKNVIIDRYL